MCVLNCDITIFFLLTAGYYGIRTEFVSLCLVEHLYMIAEGRQDFMRCGYVYTDDTWEKVSSRAGTHIRIPKEFRAAFFEVL